MKKNYLSNSDFYPRFKAKTILRTLSYHSKKHWIRKGNMGNGLRLLFILSLLSIVANSKEKSFNSEW